MNKFKTITTYSILAVVTLVAMLVVHKLETRMDDIVETEQLRFTGTVSDAPPAVAFTSMALGSFRGIIADILWLRSEMLKSKKRYFEMVQLARWITDLQPNYSGGTAYLAWNLAYNVSVTASSHEDRWRWVNEGISLVRDKALVYNPNDPKLYKELAWIYQHKVGNVLDDAHNLYKSRMAIELADIMGSGNPEWEKFAAAPANEKEFMAVYGKEHDFWKKAADCGYKDYEQLYKAFRRNRKAELPKELVAKLTGAEFTFADTYFRARLLRDRLKLDPRRIIELDKKYGKMDWRIPESLAIYWATMGVERAPGQQDIHCARVITQSLQAAFRNGRLLNFDNETFEPHHTVTIPNVNLADSAYNAYVETQMTYDGDTEHSSFRSARINYLKDAIVLLYTYGNQKKAGEFFRKLEKEDGKQKQPDLKSFVVFQLAEDVKDADVKRATAIIDNLIRQSLLLAILGEQQAAVDQNELAKEIHAKYVKDNKNVARNRLPAFQIMQNSVFEDLYRRGNDTIRKGLDRLLKSQAAERAEEQQLNQNINTPAVPGENQGR